MRRRLLRFQLAALATLALATAGHSQAIDLAPVATVPSQVATAVYVQEWGQILWGLVTRQTGTQTPSFGEPVVNPDGSVSQTFTAADGTVVVLTAFPDGSARLDITRADGVTQVVLQSVPVFDGVSVTTTDWSVTSSDGLSVSYTSVVDNRQTPFDISDDTTELYGSAVLPGGVSQTFTVLAGGGEADVQAAQSDGSTFSLSVPLAPPRFQLPDFAEPAVGTYADPAYTVHFVLTSTPVHPLRWAALVCDVGGGLTGTFSLGADFSGFGQLEQSGPGGPTLLALISWTCLGESQVYLLSGQDVHVGPAGSALDFLEHRWETLSALMAPSPAGLASGRLRRVPGGPRLGPRRRGAPRTLRGALEPTPLIGRSAGPAGRSRLAEAR